MRTPRPAARTTTATDGSLDTLLGSGDELRETGDSAQRREIGLEPGLNPVLTVHLNGPLQARERLVVVSGERVAAGGEVVRLAVSVPPRDALLQEIERAVDVAAVLLVHGLVVELV